MKAFFELRDGRQYGMPEVIDDAIKEKRSIRPAAALIARFDIDGDPPWLALGHDLDLVMRRCVVAALLGRGDNAPAQRPVFQLAHHFLLVGIPSSPAAATYGRSAIGVCEPAHT